MNKRMIILLGLASVLVVALVVDRVVLREDSDLSTPVRQAGLQPPPRNADLTIEPLLPTLDQFNAIWQRPLFTPSRRAPTQITTARTGTQSATSSASSDQPPAFTIVGVAIRPDGGSVLIKKGSRETVRAFLGEEIEGWQIEALDSETVTLSKDGQSWQLPVGGDL